MTLTVQFLTMLAMTLGGIYLGTALDTFRRLSIYWKSKKSAVYILEICFWLLQSAILFYILFRVNGGELRAYVFLACLLGFSFYQVAIASMYKKVLEMIIRIIQKTFRWLVIILNVLLVQPIAWLIKVIGTILLFLAQVLILLLRWLYTPFLWIAKVIYRMLPKRVKKLFYQFAQFYSTIKNTCKKIYTAITFKRR